MKTRNFSFILIFCFCFFQSIGQHLGFAFQEAENKGISVEHLDSLYKSATHVDTSLAVFKTDSAQELMYNAYVKFLKDFNKFLTDKNFNWDKPTKCFNRIYFNADGSIDYLLYNFKLNNVKQEELISQEKQKEFDRLLNLFIQDYKIPLTANSKFVQCSPVTYSPKVKKE